MIKETIPFNFDDVYSYIETKFNDKGYDLEEGSNTMQLVTAMSYLVSMLNANTAVNVNETILTLARKRTMALKDARVLGYEISHTQSYRYNLKLRFENNTLTTKKVIIEKYTEFVSGDYKYYYLGNNITLNIPPSSIYTDANNDSSIYKTIEVVEGNLYLFENNTDTLSLIINNVYDSENDVWGTQHYVDIPFTNVEENGIEVFLTYYDENASFFEQEQWTRTKQFMIDKDTVLEREFIRLDLIDYKTPRIYFKLGDVGYELRTGTIIQMNILVSSGVNGEMLELPVPSTLDATAIEYTLKIQGADEESLASIKQNAPLYNNTANRVITKPDYIAFSNRHAAVKNTEVWDGHDEYPHQPGHIWFSFVPSTNIRSIIDETESSIGAGDGLGLEFKLQNLSNLSNWFIEESEIRNSNYDGVWDVLDNYKVPTLEFHHRNPIYIDFEYEIKIAKYVVKTSEADINKRVFSVINNYFRDEINDSDNPDIDTETVETFSYEYFQSNLVKRIDSELTDLVGFDIYLNTSINLNEKHILEEKFNETTSSYYKEIRFHLGTPFEELFDLNGDIIFENLPNINTEDLYYAKYLWVDESTYSIDNSSYYNTSIITYSIKLDTAVIGEMKIINGSFIDIEIILYVKDTGGYSTGLNIDQLNFVTNPNGITINVKYPTSNIKVVKNTIPRLKTVKFN